MNKFTKLGLLLLVGTLLAVGTVFSQVYVSATNGDDTFGNGSVAAPYRTIQKAIDVAATGSTINVEAGIYNNTLLPGPPAEGNPIALTVAKTLTFVGTAVGVNTTVELTNGFVLNHASAVVDFGSTGTAKFNFGTGAALVLTAGSMTSAAPANVVVGSGATLTFTAGTMNFVPTKGTNLNVIFNGTTAIASTSGFMPSSFGSGTLTINKASGALTVDNATLSVTNIVHSGAGSATISGDLTVAADGDITNSSTGTLTIGTSAANTLTMSSVAGAGQVIVSGGGSVVVNAVFTYNVKNAGTSSTVGDSPNLTVGNIVALSGGASNFTANGNVTFNNTNVASSDGKNAVDHNVTLSNGGTGALSIVGTLATPLSATSFSAPTGGTSLAYVKVLLSNTSTGSLSTRTAALRGATGTNGVINNAGGTMTLGQSGDTFSTGYDVVNDGATAVMNINAAGTFTGALSNNHANSQVNFAANSSISGTVTNVGKMKLNATTLTLSRTGAVALNNTGDVFSSASGATGTGVLKFTGAAPTMTGTGPLPNVEIGSATSFSTAGNTIWGSLTTTGAGAVTIGGATVVKGNLNVNGTGTITINGATNVSGDVNMTSGNITLGTAGLTATGTFTMPQGTFTFGANTLELKGNFVRTGGLIGAVQAGTGTLLFSGSLSQSFTPGTQMNVYNVTVSNTGPFLANVIEDDKVTLGASLLVHNNFTVTTGRVEMGTSNIRMLQTGGSARFTNGGRGYAATGVGGVIFEGNGANPAGAGDGAVITGAQPFSNIYVRLSTPANNVFALGAVRISGVITFDAGGLIWNALDDVAPDLFSSSTLTLDDVLVIPTVVINTQNTHGSPFLVDGADGGAVPLAITSVYNLTYTGQTNTTMTTTDFVSGSVNNLSVLAGTAPKTITFVTANGTIKGALTVDNGETLQLNSGGARILTASGNTAAHVVNGTVTGGTFEVTGTGASLTGGSGTGNASLVADLLVDPATAGTFTSTGMKELTTLTINRTGLVSTITMNTAAASITTFTNTAGTTTLNMNSTASAILGNVTVTAGAVTLTMNGAAATTRTIAGTLDVNGGSLTLGSHINVTGAASQAGDGSLLLGDYNLILADNYTHAGTGTISAGTGAVVATVGATKNYTFTTTVNIPNFTLNSPGFGIAFVTNGLTVTTKFVHTAGDLNLGTLPLTLAGTGYTYTAGTYTSGGAAGAVHFTGTALVIDGVGSPSIPWVTVNSTGTVTLNPDNTTSPATARTLTASAGFTQTKGALALGVNDVIITGGAYSFTAGTITATTSSSVTATNTNIGEVVFNGGSLTPAVASTLSIPNVRFEAAGAATGTVGFTVTNRFTFGKGNVTWGAVGQMTLADGAVVVRVENTGTMASAPVFAGVVDVVYLNANLPATIVTGVELPTSATALRNLTINVAIGTGASQTIQLSANATVNGTLSLTSGILDLTTSTKVMNVAVGATVVRSAGSVNAAITPAGAYNLTYTGNVDMVSSSNEWPSTATITTFTVSVGATSTNRTLNLHASRTVASFTLNCVTDGSGIDLSNAGTAYTLTVTGLSTLTKGTVKTTTVGGTLAVQGDVNAAGGSFGNTVQMSFTGTASQTITTPVGGATIGNVTINKTGTTPVPTVTIAGGNLGINGTMTFVNGLVSTGSNVLSLAAPVAPGQGFDRTGVTGTNLSHVVGNVRKTLSNIGTIVGSTNERSEFPVGTSTLYRPAAVTFKPAFGIPTIPNGVSITINHVSTKPTGTIGLPIVDGVTTGVNIARYADFYWNILSNASIGNTRFDLELTASGYADFDAIGNVRIVRRLGTATDVANAWSLQGNPVEYDNFVAGGVPTVVNVNSVGGIRPEGGIFTYGLKSTLFVQNPIGNITLPDGARTFTKSLVTPPLMGGTRGTVTYSAVSANTAIATATIASNVLTVKGLIPGSTTITINAIDSEVGQIGYSFTANVTGVTDVEVVEAIPTEFALSQNYPNPFNPSTTIKFALPSAAPVTLEIYNTLGVKVRTLIAGDMMAAKFHQITWNGMDESGSVVPSGMYLYRLVAGDFKASKKMMMLK